MSLKARAILVVVIGTLMGFGLSLGGGLLAERRPALPPDISWEQARLFSEVMERVKRDYIEPIDDHTLVESAVRGMVADLDRHSQFLDAAEFEDIRISTTGNYSGVGVEVSTTDDSIIVIAPIDDTPAKRAGIESGDKIVAIDSVNVTAANMNETISRMRGPVGSHVILTVLRENVDELLVFNLKREQIQVASVYHETLAPDIGYARISQFTESTAGELSDVIYQMNDEIAESTGAMMAGLVLDLRNNPGGILDAAVDVSDLFLESGVIVTADGRTPEARFTRDASDGDILDGGPVVILVNEGSASASEIVAGALRDHERATILGTLTFGKGLVQTVMPLSKGRAIKLTTSRYYTPSGESIHETGIQPDVVVEGSGNYPELGIDARVDRENDYQLVRALEYLRDHRVVQHDSEAAVAR